MATHSSILAWEIPWTEEAGGLHFVGHKELDLTEQLSTHDFFFKSSITSTYKKSKLHFCKDCKNQCYHQGLEG